MKKRFVSMLVALVAAIACIAGLVACGGGKAEPVAGKTYEFEKVKITKGASGTAKDLAEAMMNQMFKNDYIEFGEDGTFVITMYGYAQSGTYTQSGSTITATLEGEDQTIKVLGNTVSMSGSAQGYSMKITYKLVKEETGTITSPVTEVAGTTYVFKDLEYKYADLISGDEQAQVEEMIAQLKTMYQGATIAFDDNGGYTMTVMGAEATTGTYTQNKAKVVMTGNDSIVITAAVSGNELTYDYLSMYTLYFELKEADDEDKELPKEDEDKDKESEKTYYLAGKSFVAANFNDYDNQTLDIGVFEGAKITFKANGEYTLTVNGRTATGWYEEKTYLSSSENPDTVILNPSSSAPDYKGLNSYSMVDIKTDAYIVWDGAEYSTGTGTSTGYLGFWLEGMFD